jgi:hypothetical protein
VCAPSVSTVVVVSRLLLFTVCLLLFGVVNTGQLTDVVYSEPAAVKAVIDNAQLTDV